jgi:Ger(x)C family germination protein
MRRVAVAVLIALTPLLGGCWDMTEIEDSVFVASIGVDKAGDEYLWTFRLVEPEKLILGMLTAVPGEPGRLASGTISTRAANLQQAVELMQPGMARIISLEHVRWIAFGEDVARQGLAPLLSEFLRNNQIRRGIGVYVFRGARAVDGFLANRPVSDTNALKFFEGLRLVQKRFHLSPPLTLQHFYTRLMSPGLDPSLPVVGLNAGAKAKPGGELPELGERSLKAGETPRAGGNPDEFLGTAIFRGDKLAGLLTVDETQALLALRGDMGKAYASVPDPKDPQVRVSMRIHQENKPKYRAYFVGTRPRVAVQMQLEGEILSTPGKTIYTERDNRRLLEKHIARYLEQNSFVPLLERLHKEWGTDPAGFGQLFRSRFPTHDAWLAYNWSRHVPDLQVTVSVDMYIRRFGLLLGNPNFRFQYPGGK